MSLVGSLEDLSLGDILQIISLSQKSGVLALQTKESSGRIVFVNGLVRGAAVKGGARDLRGVLIGGGFLSNEEFDASLEQAAAQGAGVASVLVATTQLSGERIDSLCRETVEAAVVTMFSWPVGDFSFDVRTEPEPGDPELLLPTGINAEYLTMEAARLCDESGWVKPGSFVSESTAEVELDSADGAGFDEMSAHELFGVARDAPTSAAESDPLESNECERSGELPAEALLEEGSECAPGQEAEPASARQPPSPETLGAAPVGEEGVLELVEGDVIDEAGPLAADQPASGSEILGAPEAVATAAAQAPARDGPLVAIDGDLLALEWVKSAVKSKFHPVHIFQQAEQGLARIRQYLVRGQPPVVLIAPGIQVDPLAGITGAADFISRLKNQSPRLKALWLIEDGSAVGRQLGPADGVIVRPERSQLHANRKSDRLEQMAEAFLGQLQSDVESSPPPDGCAIVGRDHETPSDALWRLRDVTRALTEASSRGEVLPLVIRFAAEVFSRVAMFMVRDGTAVGMAQHGLSRGGGPDDRDLRGVCVDVSSSAWMRAVLEQRRAVEGTPGNEGDRNLTRLLGDRIPGAAYLAPIESAGQVIALLYGDNLPEDGTIGDTSALEVVLHHAGLALDRASLERALRSVGPDQQAGEAS